MADNYPLVVFSHLRWDFVFQRPQHLLSKLVDTHRVFFVEEPITGDGPGWQHQTTPEGVEVWRPVLPEGAAPGFHGANSAELVTLMRGLARRESLDGAIVWLYTPLALPLARAILPELIVYDCMDELSLFQGAPPELVAMEHELLVDADLVFTGGISLYRAKAGRHPKVHCLPSSVDAGHFAMARPDAGCMDHPLQQSIPHPRLGYYGVIDERLDTGLINDIARIRPEWQIVLVGPVVKIDPATLPRWPNIHYLGQQSYADLPRFLSGWDICLLPFALNDATQFISPTKTLEYMAAGRPIASTPIRDVVESYAGIVEIGRDAKDFVAIAEKLMAMGEAERDAMRKRMEAVVAGTSWQSTAKRMTVLISEELDNAKVGVRRVLKDRPASPLPTSALMHPTLRA